LRGVGACRMSKRKWHQHRCPKCRALFGALSHENLDAAIKRHNCKLKNVRQNVRKTPL
jgi:hypothetical protein